MLAPALRGRSSHRVQLISEWCCPTYRCGSISLISSITLTWSLTRANGNHALVLAAVRDSALHLLLPTDGNIRKPFHRSALPETANCPWRKHRNQSPVFPKSASDFNLEKAE